MKLSLLSLMAGLLALGSAKARNPQPLRVKPQYIPPQGESVRRVVLVHGFLETGNSFSSMKKRLQRQGFVCLVPKLRPSDGRGGLEALAQGLKRDIDAAFGADQPIQIVAFSMGGVVSRYYLQNLGGAERCKRLFTIASPHNGTQTAWLYPTRGAEQMRPGSGFLDELVKTEAKLGSMPLVSYRTPLDLVILPASSSIWERAVNIAHPALLHPLMLNSSVVISDLEKRLAE